MNSMIKNALAEIDTEVELFAEDGEALPLSEIARIHGNEESAAELFQAAKALKLDYEDFVSLVIMAAKNLIHNAPESCQKADFTQLNQILQRLDLVLFKNGAVMLLPVKEQENFPICGFNLGWGSPTYTNAKTILAASCCYIANLQIWELYKAKSDSVENACCYYQTVMNAGLSASFDVPGFAQLID